MEDSFIFSHNFSSLEILNLIFLPFTFLSYLFSFIFSLFSSFSLFFPIPTYPFGLALFSSRTNSPYGPDVPFFPPRAQTEARVKLFAKNPN
jgi:hypothetical protein